MKKTAALLGAAVFAVSLAGAVQAQDAPVRPGPENGPAADRPHPGPLSGHFRDRMRGRMDHRGGAMRGRDMGADLLLRAADANQDGVATRAEVDALEQAVFAWNDRNGDGVLDQADRGPLAQRIAALRADRPDDPWALRPGGHGPRGDMDGDGRRTLADVTARTDALFQRLDANSDGAISADELRSAPRERPGGPDSRPQPQ